MGVPAVYIETSIVSYLTARPSRDVVTLGHQSLTLEWWEAVLPKVRPVTSRITLMEAGKGNPEAASRRLAALEPIMILSVSLEAESLARTYLEEKLIPEQAELDALHLALASAHGVDYLLTWNCRHLAAAVVRRRLASINTREGFPIPVICTPEELMEP